MKGRRDGDFQSKVFWIKLAYVLVHKNPLAAPHLEFSLASSLKLFSYQSTPLVSHLLSSSFLSFLVSKRSSKLFLLFHVDIQCSPVLDSKLNSRSTLANQSHSAIQTNKGGLHSWQLWLWIAIICVPPLHTWLCVRSKHTACNVWCVCSLDNVS